MSLKAYKYRIYPTKDQKGLLAKHFGCVRYIYNYGLNLKTEIYQKEEKGISVFEMTNKITELKKEEETEWLKEVNSQCLQQSLRNLDNAFTNFFKKQAKYPKYKSRKNKQSFSCPQNCKVDFENSKFHMPKFKGGVKCVFHRPFDGQIKTCTISKTPTDKYFVSILVDDYVESVDIQEPEKDKCLGIDLGLSHYCIDSEGNKVDNPRHLNKKLKRLKKQQQKLSKKKKDGKNREKQRRKVAKIHEKVANTRKDFLHKLSYEVAEKQGYNCVAMETLDIQGMMKNHRLAKNIGDAAWFTFQTLLDYKLKDRGKSLIKIGQFEPSSKLCNCGYKNNSLKLSDRTWKCPSCGEAHDRDILAANNIKKFAFLKQNTFHRDGLAQIQACGDLPLGGSVKQEAPML